MSELDDALVIHLALDELQTPKSFDTDISKSNNGAIHGDPQLVADDTFGSSISFDGIDDYIDFPPDALPRGNEISISFWAKGGENLPAQTSIIGAGTNSGDRILNIHLPWDDGNVFFDCGFADGAYDRIVQIAQKSDFSGKWTHWTFTKNAVSGEMKIFLNGKIWLSDTGKNKPVPAAEFLSLGSYQGVRNYPGQIAHFRVYSRALSEKEIKQIMNEDLTAAAVFGKTHPLGFNLFDDDEQQVLYITDNQHGHNLHLEIHNTSRYSIILVQSNSIGATASETDNYFELRFRPGTLLAAALDKITLDKVYLNENLLDKNQWSINFKKQTDGTVSIYFLAVDLQKVFILDPDSRLKFTLQNIQADGRGGARGTRVELKYRNLVYVDDQKTSINGTGIQHLSIVNQRGKKNIPLHAGFIGSNMILNNGESENEVILRITNADRENSIPLSRDNEALSKFIISFDVQGENENKEWALMKASEMKAEVFVKFSNKDDWKPLTEESGKQAESPEWIIKSKDLNQLNPGEFIQVKINNVKSSLSSGQTNLYVRYENIPGYWDGQFITTLEKSSLVQRDNLIGIGTGSPAGRLSISEDTGTVAGTSTGTLVIDHENEGGASSIVFRSKVNRGSDYGYIQYQDAATVGSGGESARLIVGIENDQDDHLILKPSGNVGIGAANPGAKLTIQTGETDSNSRAGGKALFVSCPMGEGKNMDGGIEFRHDNHSQGIGFGYNTIYATGYNDSQDLSIQSKGDGSQICLNPSKGDVGIGTTMPLGKLHVIASGNFGGENGDGTSKKGNVPIVAQSNSTAFGIINGNGRQAFALNIDDNTGLNNERGVPTFYDKYDGNWRSSLSLRNGYVGIGSKTPGAKLQIINENQDSNGNTLILGPTSQSNLRLGYHSEYSWIHSHGSKPLAINPSGNNVGIGTTNPTAPLEVKGFNNIHMDKGFWFAFRGEQRNSNNTYENSVSIRAEWGILSEQAFYITSDSRIKKDLQKSDSGNDMDILSRLEVTDYKYIDFANRGEKSKKGFIAQQVEKIFPQAVGRQTSVIPDIYRQASFNAGWIELATNLEKGERVKLISETGAENIYEVLETAKDKFRVNFESEGKKVFVFGREVDDFRILDYDSITVLNVSATQQLKKETDEKLAVMQIECDLLKIANEKLTEKLKSLESKLFLNTSAATKTV